LHDHTPEELRRLLSKLWAIDVPTNAIVGGVPAKVIKMIE